MIDQFAIRRAWALLTLLAFGWGIYNYQQAQEAIAITQELREQNQLLRQLGKEQQRWYIGTEYANQKCAESLAGLLERLGLDPQLQTLVTTSVIRRYGVGGGDAH